MSEIWLNLFSKLEEGLLKCLTLQKVMVNRKGTRMTVCFDAARLLDDQEFHKIKAALQEGFPGIALKLMVAYPDLAQRFTGDINGFVSFIDKILCEESPGVRPFLRDAQWELKDKRVILSIGSAAGVTFMQEKQIDRTIEKLLNTLFGLELSVKLEVRGQEQERIRQIEEKRRQDEERMAKLVAEAPKAADPAKPRIPSQLLGRPINDPPISTKELTEDAGRVTLMGEVLSVETRNLKNDTMVLLSFALTDYEGTVPCKAFLSTKPRGSEETSEAMQKQVEALLDYMKQGAWIKARGNYRYDDFKKEMTLMVSDIVRAEAPKRVDTAERKRVELHMHTQMSTMDATASASDLIKQAAQWGHPAVAITDHGVVQAFPEAFGAAKKNNIKLIPGCEGYLIDDSAIVVENSDNRALEGISYVVLDVETTGLNKFTDMITEIGAVRIENGREVAEFSQLINPGRPIPEKVVELTGITDAMVRDKPTIDQVIRSFEEFCKGAVLVAHNASFDMAFFKRAFEENGLDFDYPMMDTLTLVRNQYPEFKSYKLGNMCKQLGIRLVNAHRAVNDARATGQMLLKVMGDVVEQHDIERLDQLNEIYTGDAGGKSYHIILLAATQEGMANLNRLVSEGHLHYFNRRPRMPRGLIRKYREGLIIGSACESGELFRAMVEGKDQKTLERIARFYDYLEIQPIGNNEFMIREGTAKDEEELRDYNRRIVKLGEKLKIPVVATGDVHFKEPKDAIFRAILMASKGFEDADFQPPLYFKTTDEMLEEFSYLGKEKAMEVVVDNPNAIADRVGKLSIFIKHPEGKETFQPFWPEAEHEIRELSETKAREIFGDPLPELVQKRLDKELGSIIGYGFSTLYDIAVKLVKKSLSDGYIVGSRGSVGSSYVAHLTGITEVDALPPHYACPKCKHYEFDVPHEYTCGLDLPPKNCPECGTLMNKDGYNIPFEVFLGFKGDKVPDIDLNFSGEYQPVAHNYVKELFGKENVFRAGTIGTVAEKTAYGYVLKYLEERGITVSNAEKERLALGCTGAKRTTGQHPAGMVVLPKGYEIYQFTAIQHPADDMTSDTVTTHFDFSSMHDVLVKLDILGHDDPTMLRKLQDLTGIAPQQVPLDDPEVYQKIISLFTGTEALGATAEEIGCKVGTLGIPEFGTKFVRQMLEDTKPKSMEELIRISGLSHGTDVWLGNAQDIIKAGIAPLNRCICTRDDIMNQLMEMGVEPKMAFTIMESVRKGKGLTSEMEEAMVAANTPEWFIDSCKKIKYMFPKAHAVAYVVMALRIAYFKVFYPTAYYACYLKRNADAFDGSRMITSPENLRKILAEIDELPKNEKEREADTVTIIEILLEMAARGIKLLPVNLYKSHAEDFLIVAENTILPPLSSLPGLGLNAALNLAAVREGGPFISQEDMVRRKVAKSVVETLRQNGCLDGLPETSQVSLFDGLTGM